MTLGRMISAQAASTRSGRRRPRSAVTWVTWITQETAGSGGLACVLPPYRNAAGASWPSPPRRCAGPLGGRTAAAAAS